MILSRIPLNRVRMRVAHCIKTLNKNIKTNFFLILHKKPQTVEEEQEKGGIGGGRGRGKGGEKSNSQHNCRFLIIDLGDKNVSLIYICSIFLIRLMPHYNSFTKESSP